MPVFVWRISLMKRFIVLVFGLILLISGAAQAQDNSGVTRTAYYLAADTFGVQQVYQLMLGTESVSQPITTANQDVLTFGVSPDGRTVAYVSAEQLWLQSSDSTGPEAVIPVTATRFLGSPVFDPNGQYLAYPDHGVWVMDLATRETRQILEDTPLEIAQSTGAEFRLQWPAQFVSDAEGQPTHLMVKMVTWEWGTVGVYALATGDFAVLEGREHYQALPLSDARVLLYGNGGIAGLPALHIADDLMRINDSVPTLQFSDFTDEVLFATQAVEYAPGKLRIIGQTISTTPNELYGFTFDYDVTAGLIAPVRWLTFSDAASQLAQEGPLSPDGALLPVYQDVSWNEHGGISGRMTMLDVATGEMVPLTLPDTVSIFRWQP
jgi:hypothetical protein